jgi:YesN/AraC family two-component response regulator
MVLSATTPYDLVVSDVMMPEMDGISMLKRIKENPQVSQTPVIMLTSKAEVEHKLEGLKNGADAYIAKPFNMEELHIQIDNLIDGVRRLKGKFSGAVQQKERIANLEVKGNDDALMERIMRSINAHISESDYNVDSLAEDVGISRAQLHRKMKEITGIASGKFLRNLRMEQAARLLSEGKVGVAQVAYKVGYADQAHFSTAFKTHFGLSPSEYAEKHKND